MHGLTHLVWISPEKDNFVPKIAISPHLLMFFLGHSEPRHYLKPLSLSYLTYLEVLYFFFQDISLRWLKLLLVVHRRMLENNVKIAFVFENQISRDWTRVHKPATGPGYLFIMRTLLKYPGDNKIHFWYDKDFAYHLLANQKKNYSFCIHGLF